jgi:hypothetical protein
MHSPCWKPCIFRKLLCPGCRCLLPQGAPRLLFMRAFAHLFEGKPSGLNTVNILRSMPHLTQLRAAINQTVIDDFTAAREAVRVRVTRAYVCIVSACQQQCSMGASESAANSWHCGRSCKLRCEYVCYAMLFCKRLCLIIAGAGCWLPQDLGLWPKLGP